ncbi:LysM peptidoglycan-binding domain-containing protein [Paenibacillus antarcticus]|uniref:LysM domain-containing protein n=1 Tax=Paenibacillus antarcticus TaxID=253703 RepID=A0A168QQZ1_9BACL|nr:LysM peptidoglycan-binding domain-containing protein [Paenibacillus antarcticus]OAB48091.1 hypothetical protein PBAT_00130 [Paenibacillus antarcticus]
MFDQSYGLRFDIYERIQLSEEVAGIAELEEIELLPYIQVISQEDQAALRGHLILTGLYRGEGEENASQRLEHYIPVEITVPLNRVTSLDEIGVEIENFDVDLLSERSLNITGVLSLRGIESFANDTSSWNAEDFTVVHSPDQQLDYNESPRPSVEDVAYTNLELSDEHTFGISDSVGFGDQDGYGTDGIHTPLLHTEDETARQKDHSNVWNIGLKDTKEHFAVNEIVVEPISHDENEHSTLDLLEEELSPVVTSPEVVQDEEKSELRIGLGSKREVPATTQDNVGLSSILTSSRLRTQRDQEQQAQEEQLIAQEINHEHLTNEDVQWKSLFLGGSSERTPFSKVRLCIVQREETLDLIADRYQLSPRELLLYNRLSEQTIEEGQILYIP